MENINCPYCGCSYENPVFEVEDAAEILCEECDGLFVVEGKAKWDYIIGKLKTEE